MTKIRQAMLTGVVSTPQPTDYPTVAAARDAPMPTLAADQKGVLISVTGTDGVTLFYQKTTDGIRNIIVGELQ